MEIISALSVVIGAILAIFLLTVMVGAPYVPTHTKQFIKLLQYLKLNPDKDVLIDLGFGDGKILRLAASRTKRVIGYEINPILWLVAWLPSRKFNNIDLRLADFRLVDLPLDATVIYIFSVGTYESTIVKLLRSQVEKTGKSLKLISYGFEFAELGEPEAVKYGFCVYQIMPSATSQKTKKSV